MRTSGTGHEVHARGVRAHVAGGCRAEAHVGLHQHRPPRNPANQAGLRNNTCFFSSRPAAEYVANKLAFVTHLHQERTLIDQSSCVISCVPLLASRAATSLLTVAPDTLCDAKYTALGASDTGHKSYAL